MKILAIYDASSGEIHAVCTLPADPDAPVPAPVCRPASEAPRLRLRRTSPTQAIAAASMRPLRRSFPTTVSRPRQPRGRFAGPRRSAPSTRKRPPQTCGGRFRVLPTCTCRCGPCT